MIGHRMDGRNWRQGAVRPHLEAAPVRRLAAAGLVLFLLAGGVQFYLTARLGERDESIRVDRIPPVDLLAALPPLPRRLAADLLWVRALQSYGYHRQKDLDFSPLAAHFDAVTRVDPKFEIAYDFGGLVLAQEGHDPERGIALLTRGMAHLPDSWLLPFETGFVYYVAVGDVANAARYFQRASERPGAPEYVKHFAAYSSSRAGRRDIARYFWEAIYQETDREVIRRLATDALRKLDAEDDAESDRQSLSHSSRPAHAEEEI